MPQTKHTITVPATNTNSDGVEYYGGWSHVWCAGDDFDGATITIEESFDGSNWVTAKDVFGQDLAFVNANGSAYYYGAQGVQLRATVSGGGGSVDVTLEVYHGLAAMRQRYDA